MSIFTGAGTAMATPMNADGSINFDALEKMTDDQIAGNIDALIVCGTSGEAPTLEDDEHIEAIAVVAARAAGRVPVIAGTGSNNTAHACMMSERARNVGADACLLVAPYYNKATQAGLIESFTCIAEAAEIPCILYNVPSRTSTNILPETAAYLGKHCENIVAIKEASGDISQIAKCKELGGDDLDVYSGNDDQTIPIMSLGGIGVISVLSNVAPQFTHDMAVACLEGDYKKAAAMQLKCLELVRSLFCEVNPIPVKAALNMQGYDAGIPRLPLTEMTEKNQERLRRAMAEMGCL
ncbi:MAG: 4-hydroxy-tetrahydrodipicolinate synthase [Lachnospiraceae bacterium]|nr:4-hydroxy-tetrahydrodipicolinate synthase [Lachnospiraceae bacterium]